MNQPTEKIHKLVERLCLLAEGMESADRYAHVDTLPVHLRNEGVEQSAHYKKEFLSTIKKLQNLFCVEET